jgi:hypothetical protein
MGIDPFQVGALIVLGLACALIFFRLRELNARARQGAPSMEKPAPYGDESRQARRSRRMAMWLIAVAWAFGFVTNLARVAQIGRPDRITVGQVQESSSWAGISVQFFLVLFAAVAGLLILDNVKTESRTVSIGYLALLFAPFIALLASDLLNAQRPAIDALLYPLSVFALWRAQMPIRALAVVGWLTVISTTISLGLGVFMPELGTTLAPIVGQKTLWPTLLAGPYGHPNVLGLGLSLGVPFIFLIRQKAVRNLGLVATLAAVIWSGNRGSIAAVVLGLIVYFIMYRRPRARFLPAVLLVAVTALTVGLPLVTTDPAAFSLRGRIWTTSFEYFWESPLIGNGTNFYGLIGRFHNSFGEQAFNGHNAFVHLLTTGGVLLLLGVACVLIATYRRAAQRVGQERAIAVSFVIMLILNSLLQNTITYTGLSELAYGGWLCLAVLAFAPVRLISTPSSVLAGQQFAQPALRR